MREYEFRGRSIEPLVGDDQWLYGFGVHKVELADGGWEYWLFTDNGPYQVYPETVGQYTGIKDRNGKKIYEGDLLDISDRVFPQEVHMDEGCYGTEEFALYELVRNQERTFKVIGIIYDNPELLEANV